MSSVLIIPLTITACWKERSRQWGWCSRSSVCRMSKHCGSQVRLSIISLTRTSCSSFSLAFLMVHDCLMSQHWESWVPSLWILDSHHHYGLIKNSLFLFQLGFLDRLSWHASWQPILLHCTICLFNFVLHSILHIQANLLFQMIYRYPWAQSSLHQMSIIQALYSDAAI